MKHDSPTIIILCVCVIIGYFVFSFSLNDVPDYDELYNNNNIGTYVFEYPHDGDIYLYTVLGGDHHFYFLTRNFADTTGDGEKDFETITIRNDIDEPLKIDIIERHSESEDRPFTLEFLPRNEEVQLELAKIEQDIYLQVAMREAIVFGIGGIVIYFWRTKLRMIFGGKIEYDDKEFDDMKQYEVCVVCGKETDVEVNPTNSDIKEIIHPECKKEFEDHVHLSIDTSEETSEGNESKNS